MKISNSRKIGLVAGFGMPGLGDHMSFTIQDLDIGDFGSTELRALMEARDATLVNLNDDLGALSNVPVDRPIIVLEHGEPVGALDPEAIIDAARAVIGVAPVGFGETIAKLVEQADLQNFNERLEGTVKIVICQLDNRARFGNCVRCGDRDC